MSQQQKRGGRGPGKEDPQVIHKFVLGTKELDGKTAEFQYDRGWYLITDIIGEERIPVFKSKNAPEAYTKWNVYIGRKKERPSAEERKKQRDDQRENTAKSTKTESKEESAGNSRNQNRSRKNNSENNNNNRTTNTGKQQ